MFSETVKKLEDAIQRIENVLKFIETNTNIQDTSKPSLITDVIVEGIKSMHKITNDSIYGTMMRDFSSVTQEYCSCREEYSNNFILLYETVRIHLQHLETLLYKASSPLVDTLKNETVNKLKDHLISVYTSLIIVDDIFTSHTSHLPRTITVAHDHEYYSCEEAKLQFVSCVNVTLDNLNDGTFGKKNVYDFYVKYERFLPCVLDYSNALNDLRDYKEKSLLPTLGEIENRAKTVHIASGDYRRTHEKVSELKQILQDLLKEYKFGTSGKHHMLITLKHEFFNEISKDIERARREFDADFLKPLRKLTNDITEIVIKLYKSGIQKVARLDQFYEGGFFLNNSRSMQILRAPVPNTNTRDKYVLLLAPDDVSDIWPLNMNMTEFVKTKADKELSRLCREYFAVLLSYLTGKDSELASLLSETQSGINLIKKDMDEFNQKQQVDEKFIRSVLLSFALKFYIQSSSLFLRIYYF